MNFTNAIIFNTDDRELFDKLQENLVFSRFIDLLIFAISIGVVHDKQKEPKGEEKIEIASNTIAQPNVKNALTFLFETAMLTTSKIQKKFSEDERLKLAFNSDYEIENFDKLKFLLEFAPYGVQIIRERILRSEEPVQCIENLEELIEELLKDDIESEILNEIIEDDIAQK